MVTNSAAAVQSILQIHPSVRDALSRGESVIALESTILAHGLPNPANERAAFRFHSVARANGATPATVAVLNGIPHIGLSDEQVIHLCRSRNVHKLSIRDIPVALALKQDGATTVAATMFLSAAAGIRVFATGGIGGVHRGVPHPLDISADIPALASIPQLVVSAGVKSILDVRNTLELLETASVPTLVLGSDTFPAFLHRSSSEGAPVSLQSERDVAKVFSSSAALGLRSGILLAVPIPAQYNSDAQLIRAAEQRALNELSRKKLASNQVTPFLLRRVAELTHGVSVRANVALAENNVAVASRVAVHLSQIERGSSLGVHCKHGRPHVLVIGGTALDVHCDPRSILLPHTSNIGAVRVCAGGVGRNIAHAASTHGRANVTFVSCVGDDAAADTLLRLMKEAHMDARYVRRYAGKRSGVVCVVHDHRGDLSVAVADLTDMFGDDHQEGVPFAKDARQDIAVALRTARIALLDANFRPSELRQVALQCEEADVPVWYEPTSLHKCRRIIQAEALHAVKYISPNEAELRTMAGGLGCKGGLDECAASLLRACRKGASVMCTRGEHGVRRYSFVDGDLLIDDFEAIAVEGVLINTTGAGDCFAGVCVAALAAGDAEYDAIRKGIEAAALSCKSEHAVPQASAKL
ncbi:pseudouridine-metabolizing bifunctional protein C186105 [Gracilaria domingensis]|nr:pseudouridine-metabolizing bifunctional protein C186105 [Gracilaria domingensis]